MRVRRARLFWRRRALARPSGWAEGRACSRTARCAAVCWRRVASCARELRPRAAPESCARELRQRAVVVYVKFDKSKPRSEPASGFAGGKVVLIVWNGAPSATASKPSMLFPRCDRYHHKLNQLGSHDLFRPNWLVKPFDGQRVRQALWYAFNQEDFLKAAIGDWAYYIAGKAYFICGATFASEEGMEGRRTSNLVKRDGPAMRNSRSCAFCARARPHQAAGRSRGWLAQDKPPTMYRSDSGMR